MLANMRFARKGEDNERRQHYKSVADSVLLSRNNTTQKESSLKFNTGQSEQAIFDMLSTYIKK
ncbi:hypothetical protein [Proteus terrae]|uniref:hypothetical protein n=1 Tax=Proteus terrae TaxID=1574161 RepID=UPI00301D501D